MNRLLFFDGDCGLCSRSIRLLARLDSRERLSFAPLQGGLAAGFGLDHHAADHGGTMVVMREPGGELFYRSDAMIEIARALGGVWAGLVVFAMVPRPWRDSLYQFVADRRHLLVRKNRSCTLPDERVRRRLRE